MKRASAIVTNRGGRTCHAAIIARELGIPAVVGCGDATQKIRDGQEVTVSCAEGDTGYVYEGLLEFERSEIELDAHAADPGQDHDERRQPGAGLRLRRACPNTGVGLARLEFIINRMIGVHPRALLDFDQPRRRAAGADPQPDGRLRGPGELLRRQAGRGHRAHRRGLRAGAGDRAPVGLQVQRVRQPHRRRALRAGRREPDARASAAPRATSTRASATASSWSAAR